MTEQQAIASSIKMWQWLHDHPKKDKLDYFELTGGKFNCHCCIYYHDGCTRGKKKCPLYDYHCDFPDGAYYKWMGAASKKNGKTSKKYSGIILELLKKRERELNLKK